MVQILNEFIWYGYFNRVIQEDIVTMQPYGNIEYSHVTVFSDVELDPSYITSNTRHVSSNLQVTLRYTKSINMNLLLWIGRVT